MKSSSTVDAGSNHSAMYDLTKKDMEIMVTTMVRPSGVRTQRSSTPTFRTADTSPQRSPSRARPAAPKKMAADVAQSPMTEKPEGLPTPSAAAVALAPSTPPTRASASRSPAPQSRADAELPPPGLGKPSEPEPQSHRAAADILDPRVMALIIEELERRKRGLAHQRESSECSERQVVLELEAKVERNRKLEAQVEQLQNQLKQKIEPE